MEDGRAAKAGVLVVDDEALVRRTWGRVLRMDGHEVIEAADGQAALARHASALKSGLSPVVVLDLGLPGMSGRETLAELRALDPQVRILVVSGSDVGELRTEPAMSAVAGFLQKPVRPALLQAAVRNLVHQHDEGTAGS